jgi:hypothetical protein
MFIGGFVSAFWHMDNMLNSFSVGISHLIRFDSLRAAGCVGCLFCSSVWVAVFDRGSINTWHDLNGVYSSRRSRIPLRSAGITAPGVYSTIGAVVISARLKSSASAATNVERIQVVASNTTPTCNGATPRCSLWAASSCRNVNTRGLI